MELSFISEKCKFWVKNTIRYHLQKPVTKMWSSLVCLLQLFESVLFYMAIDVSILPSILFQSNKDPDEHTLFTHLKIVDKSGTGILTKKPSFT
jgi:hypothetical protein